MPLSNGYSIAGLNRGASNMERCFACSRKLSASKAPCVVTCMDEQTAYVGPECFRHVASAGLGGWQPSKGGPRLYTVEAKTELQRAREE